MWKAVLSGADGVEREEINRALFSMAAMFWKFNIVFFL
jgi:hypothetical protein